MANRVLAFVRNLVTRSAAPEPPPIVRDVPGGMHYFMDEDEATVIYQRPWPYVGCPTDERTNSVVWLIDGQSYAPSRRDENGNWIFRRCAK